MNNMVSIKAITNCIKRYGEYRKTNVVGRIVEEEIFLLDYLQAWDKFGFTLKK